MNEAHHGPGGFSEAGIATRNLSTWIEFLTTVGGYQPLWEGPTPASMVRSWGLPAEVEAHEVLLGCPGHDGGYIRLFRFHGVDQQEIRAGTHTWDSGGIFDLDVRVNSLIPFVERMEKRGWKGVSAPIDWPFGQLQVREWLAWGPDSVIFALVERLAPPLEGWRQFEHFGHVFNSSQIVSDMQRSVAFYESLGFSEVVRHQGPLDGPGGEVLGLTPEEAPVTPVELVILQGQGQLDGSIELVRIPGKPDHGIPAEASPWNLGLNLLRFPVPDLDAFAASVRSGIELEQPLEMTETRLEPFGETRLFALQSPDGAWLEFYQQFESGT